jgi:uncharacterized membrane protein YgcG
LFSAWLRRLRDVRDLTWIATTERNTPAAAAVETARVRGGARRQNTVTSARTADSGTFNPWPDLTRSIGDMRTGTLLAICVALGLLSGAAAADRRTMYWRALDVTARIDDDGRLHVRERQTIVFDGAWNGGERRFRVEGGQRLQLLGVARLDAAGAAHALKAGGLSKVGEYKLFDPNVLRWRSRLPSDPPFRDAERTYQIDYVLTGVLRPGAGGYVLNHDFAFPDRPGVIERFALTLTFSSAWTPQAPFAGEIVRQNLAPGQSVVVTLPLRYLGTGTPQAVAAAAAGNGARPAVPFPLGYPEVPAWRYMLLAVFLGFSAWCAGGLLRHERQRGRFDPLRPAEAIDPAWLEQHVFSLPPEVAGAAWDYRTSAPEVTAVLARMALEGKIKSEVQPGGFRFWRRDVLHLALQHDRKRLSRYELKLVNALFFDGDTTDTDRIRKHYRSRGFSPAGILEPALRKTVSRLLPQSVATPAWRTRVTASMFLAGVAMGAAAAWFDEDARIPVTAIAGGALLAYAYARLAGDQYKKQVANLLRYALPALAMIAAMMGVLIYALTQHPFGLGAWSETALTLLVAALVDSGLRALRAPDTADATRIRKALAAARRYFDLELRTRHPRLKDAWLPYVLAFGLGPRVDRWFRSQGRVGTGDASVSSFGSSSTTTTGWSGGGGTFGGAGATGSWASAVAGIAAGVSAASSASAGSGGGGSGGGSSGGGGGGGW